MTLIPVDSMADLLVNLDDLHERGVPVVEHIDAGHLSSLRYTTPSGVDVLMVFDPDEFGPTPW